MAVSVSTFLLGIDGGVSRSILKDDARYEFYDLNGTIDPQHQFPVSIESIGDCLNQQNVKWIRSLNSESGKTTIKDAGELTGLAKKAQNQIMTGDKSLVLPLISYYGTGRLYAQKKEKRNLKSLTEFKRQVGYVDCMAAESNEKLIQMQTLKSLQEQQKTGILDRPLLLKTVEKAICRSFERISGARNASLIFDLDTHRLVLEFETADGNAQKFAMDEMSDGYKNTLSMIGDIAYRMAVLNPTLGDLVLEKTPGVVLIDEIDLHLHPQWQQTILSDLNAIFPEVQFIVSSHAPAVINSIPREQIRILDHGEIYKPAAQTYGRDANSILREVMNVSERPADIKQRMDLFYAYMDENNYEEADKVLTEIEVIVGTTDPNIAVARTSLDLERILRKLSEKVDKTLRVVSRIQDELKKDADKAKNQSAQLLDIANCDAFRGLNGILIDWALDQLNDEILDAQIDGMNLEQIAEQRTAKSCHFGSVYKNEYQAIKYAYQMMKAVSVLEVTSDIKEMVADYQKQTYLIDSYYRWFYSAYDCMEDTECFAQVRERIENMYSFTYLQKVTPKWNQELTENLMADTGLKRQEDFYRNYLKAYEGKNRVIVIISDAFRYECAKELMERLELDEKCTPKLECMISGLPSVTSVGMASLLPHKELYVDEKLNVTVDGQSCGDLASRDKILKVQNENNVALSFDEVASANKEKIRELLQKKNIVYIYHNQVDARGDKPASENEVFTACSEAIEEIHKLIKKLTGYISAAKFFVTADHGFLYKRDKLHEFDKVSYDREICAYSNKRFLLTTQKVNEPGMKSRIQKTTLYH